MICHSFVESLFVQVKKINCFEIYKMFLNKFFLILQLYRCENVKF